MKREQHIHGKALVPLQKGNVALISKHGTCIRTSPVVAIREEEESYVCFETQNSIYHVYGKPLAYAAHAIFPPFYLMCA